MLIQQLNLFVDKLNEFIMREIFTFISLVWESKRVAQNETSAKKKIIEQ